MTLEQAKAIINKSKPRIIKKYEPPTEGEIAQKKLSLYKKAINLAKASYQHLKLECLDVIKNK